MKPQILLLAFFVVALGSCTTAYKTGQTPDDVYFSPAQPQDEYAQVEKRDNRRYEGSDEYYDDRYLRMRVSNRYRWSELDDWYYYGGRYDYSFYNVHNLYNPWTPCSYWNNYYNPYHPGYVIVKPGKPVFSGPRVSNLNTYNNNLLTNRNYTNPKPNNGVRVFGNSGSNQSGRNVGNTRSADRNSGNFLRNVFNNNNNSNSNPGRANNNSSNSNSGRSNTSSGSSNSGSSSGGSAPVRRF